MLSKLLVFALLPAAAFAQASNLVAVVAKPVSRTVEISGEIQPYLSVALHAKVAGYVERMLVDRGSMVKQGELLAELSAPEMTAHIAQAESDVQAADANRIQAEAQLAAAQATLDRLQKAAQTEGAVAGNEIVQAQKQVDAADALVRSRRQTVAAAQSAAQAQKDLRGYLKITAPFDGVVTDRLVHPGALVGPGPDPVLLVIQQVSRLRILVPVPEEDAGALPRGASVIFHVPAFPERTFTGTVARIAHALDTKTRTMPVELDFVNRDGALAPGMFPQVIWPIRSGRDALFVPRTAVVTTTERTFVIRDNNGKAEWVDVKKGAMEGDTMQVSGALRPGDKVVRRGTDEIHDGSPLSAR